MMEDALFSNDIFRHDLSDPTEEADDLNEETFGLCDDDIIECNDDWEKHHAELSKLIEADGKGFRSYNNDVVEPTTSRISTFERHQERHISISDAEEEIIENTISSLGLDDDVHYEVKTNTPTQTNLAFEESHLSWTSPIRGKEHRSDSLQELISPGGVWASPSRDSWMSPARENSALWSSPSTRDCDDLWPSPSRDSLLGDLIGKDTSFDEQYNEKIIHRFISDDSIISSPLASTPPPVSSNHYTPSPSPHIPSPSPHIPSAIRLEDLERELIKDKPKPPSQPPTPQPPSIERHPNGSNRASPFPTPQPPSIERYPNGSNRASSFPGIPPPGIPPPGMCPSPMNINRIASPMDFNRMSPFPVANQPLDAVNFPPLMPGVVPCPPMPYYLNPAVFGNTDLYQQQLNRQHKYKHHSRSNNGYESRDRYQKHYWQRELHPEKFKEIDYEEFIQMGPSKMMNAKEKKWIFKISLMSLLGGDPNTSDYYFISLFTKSMLDEAASKRKDKEMRKNLEKTNQLVNYAQQQQQTKESHKPVKFKGSLGKLSITSVHHPRQIMDFSTQEQEAKHLHSIDETGKRKFVIYGIVEKMYSALLVIMDMELEEKDIQGRLEKINELFDFFKIELWNSQIVSDTNHFGSLMSIYKGRKLFIRTFLLFNQEQSESLFISLLNILPSLLKKDKEQCMLQFNEKLAMMLEGSKEIFKLKCIKLLRKIDLKILLVYSTSILMLATLLDSLEEKNPSVSLEWSYYVEEIPKTLRSITGAVSLKVKPQLDHLVAVLGAETNKNANNIG